MLYARKGKWVSNKQISKIHTTLENGKCYGKRQEEMSGVEILGLIGKITFN